MHSLGRKRSAAVICSLYMDIPIDTQLCWLMYRKEKTGVDRFSLRQAVIFICATNRPDELDPEFVRPGRIDRRLYIGLPDSKQRVQIFGVHSSGKQIGEDVDFGKVSCRGLLHDFIFGIFFIQIFEMVP